VIEQLIIGAIVLVFAVIGYFVWDRRYRGGTEGLFKPTAEVFKDPTSGQDDPRLRGPRYRKATVPGRALKL